MERSAEMSRCASHAPPTSDRRCPRDRLTSLVSCPKRGTLYVRRRRAQQHATTVRTAPSTPGQHRRAASDRRPGGGPVPQLKNGEEFENTSTGRKQRKQDENKNPPLASGHDLGIHDFSARDGVYTNPNRQRNSEIADVNTNGGFLSPVCFLDGLPWAGSRESSASLPFVARGLTWPIATPACCTTGGQHHAALTPNHGEQRCQRRRILKPLSYTFAG